MSAGGPLNDEPLTRRPLVRVESAQTWAAFGCFLLSLLLYLSTAARTVQGGDAAEFGLLGVLGGVAHPPGYPLYTLLSRICAWLGTGPLFFRVSVASALCGAAAVAAAQRVSYRLSGDLYSSIAAALLFAVIPLQWRLAGIPEVFTLHAVLCLLVVDRCLSLANAEQAVNRRAALLVGLCFGLALSNHLTSILLVPLVAWAVSSAVVRHGRAAIVTLTIAGCALGLLPYAALPIFARTANVDAPVWGRVETLRGFFDHVLRREYGTFRLTSNGDSSFVHFAPLMTFAEQLPRQWGYVPLVLALIGGVVLVRRRVPGALALALTLALSGPLFVALFNTPMARDRAVAVEERFHLMPIALLTPFVACGIAWLTRTVGQRVRVAALVAAVAVLAWTNRKEADWRSDRTLDAYCLAAVERTDPGAVILGSSDMLFSAVPWVTHALNVRPDVRYADLGMTRFPWYSERLAKEIPQLTRATGTGPVWKFAAALAASGVPTYTMTWNELDPDRLAIDMEGFVDRIVHPWTPERPIDQLRSDLQQATDRLGELPAVPAGLDEGVVRTWAAQRWIALANRYDRTGRSADANQCRARAKYLEP